MSIYSLTLRPLLAALAAAPPHPVLWCFAPYAGRHTRAGGKA